MICTSVCRAAAVWMFVVAWMYLVPTASAATLFQDGFDDDTVGSPPVISGGNVGDSWDLFVPVPPDGEAFGQVHDENAGSGDNAGVPPHAGSGSQYLALNRIDDMSPIATADVLGPSISSGEVTFSFEAYVKATAGRGQVFFSDGVNTGTFDRLVNLFFENGAVLEFNGSSLETVAGLSFTTDAWQHVEISLDLDNNTYSVDVEHGASTGGGTFLDDAVTAGRNLGAVHFSAAGNGAVSFFDDVSATFVPEPTTCLLGWTGVAASVIFVRRRNRS